jgi:uncharacterized GH25 family protein
MRNTVLAFIVLLAVRAQAHDFWIEPSSFRPELGETFTASLYVGQDFAGDPVPRSTSLLDSFVVRDAAGERAVNGFENQDPAGFVRVDEAGTAVIGYRSKPSPLEITPEKFAQFLREEGIRGVDVPNKPHRVHFYRFAKTIVQAGKATPALATKPFGYRLELVPLDATHYQLLFERKPLPGAQVMAIARDEERKLSARTDANGRVTLDLPRGVWLVKAVHLVRAPATANVEWESLWASLTFEH